MTERLPILNKNLADKVKKIWEIENLPSKKPSFDQEVQAFSLLRRTHPDIVELISKIAELPEDQQELVAGHWKWALEVVEKQQKKDESIAKEERTDYHAKLDALLPRIEIGLGEALVKISEIAYLNELTEQDIMYLHKKAVEHYKSGLIKNAGNASKMGRETIIDEDQRYQDIMKELRLSSIVNDNPLLKV